MLEIEKTLISLDVLRKKFCCDLSACAGACCVKGDSGAPLNKDELGIIEEVYPSVRQFMREEGIDTVDRQGLYVIDYERETVTPLINKGECAYVVFENGIALCAIEMAYKAGLTDWKKPLSCHLYPIRIKHYKHYDAVNFDSWDICSPALAKGNELGLPVYVFVREALIRAYGSEWFEHLDYAARNLEVDEK